MIYHQNVFAAALDRHVAPGTRWLDVGAGARLHGGWQSVSQKEIAARASCLVGCDVVAEHLAANPYLTDYRVGQAEALPFPDAAFDLVTANMVLEHVEHPAQVLSEIARVLVPGGRFIAMTPRWLHPLVCLSSLLVPSRVRSLLAHVKEQRPDEHIFPTHYRLNSAAAITKHARGAGLLVMELHAFQSLPFAHGIPVLQHLETLMHWRSNYLIVLAKPVTV